VYNEGSPVIPFAIPLPGTTIGLSTDVLKISFNLQIEDGETVPSSGQLLGYFVQPYEFRLASQDTSGLTSGTMSLRFDTSMNAQSVLAVGNRENFVPIGFQGNMLWQYVDSQGNFLAQTTTPMEFYVLHPNLSPYFTDNKGLPIPIPIKLLRIFLRQSIQSGITTRTAWLQWVTKIIHGSLDPNTGKQKNTSDHFFKYEVWVGEPAYTGELGGSFKLEKWLNFWKEGETGIASPSTGAVTHQSQLLHTVNCFDQAGIAWIALSLGMDHNTLAWEHKQVYGYLKQCQLVGWGDCNNPFFAGDKDQRCLENNDGRRQPFRNHVFISFGDNGVNGQDSVTGNLPANKRLTPDKSRFIIDACAGPYVGNQTYTAYEQGAIDPSGLQERLQKENYSVQSRWDENTYTLLSGIVALDQTTTGTNLWTEYDSQYGIADATQQSFNPTFTDPPVLVALNLDTVLDRVDGFVKSRSPLYTGWTDSSNTSFASQDTTEVEVGMYGQTPSHSHRIRESWTVKDWDHSFYYVKITTHVSRDVALDCMKNRITLFSPPGDAAFTRVVNGAGDLHFQLACSKTIELFMYQNIIVELGGFIDGRIRNAEWKKASAVNQDSLLYQASMDLANYLAGSDVQKVTNPTDLGLVPPTIVLSPDPATVGAEFTVSVVIPNLSDPGKIEANVKSVFSPYATPNGNPTVLNGAKVFPYKATRDVYGALLSFIWRDQATGFVSTASTPLTIQD
jgi:hypothetical protein